MPHNVPEYFESYADLYNRAAAGEDVYDAIMERFTDTFLAAGPQGVEAAKQGHGFRKTLEKAHAFYEEIGMQKMSVQKVDVTPIDPTHSMAKVFYHADYEKKDGTPVGLDFDVTYLLETGGTAAKIFAFVAGDEMQAYRDAGLIPDKPKDGARFETGVEEKHTRH